MNNFFWQKLEKPIIGLSPMDGVSDAPFRLICAKYGKPSVHMTEFTSVEGICHAATKPLMAFLYDEIERPIVAQLFGTDPLSFYKSSILACAMGFDGIDINMGCPANSVANRGAGAGLIKTPELAKEIIEQCQKATQDWANGIEIEKVELPEKILEFSKIHWKKYFEKSPQERHLIPVSVKTRIGLTEITIEEWVKHLLEKNPANISIHGRTLRQMYEGSANWEAIAKGAQIIKQTSTTVLGNGDIHSLEDAHHKIKTYGVDGVLIGRGSYGNPWIFNKDITYEEISTQKKLETAIEHSRYFEQTFGTTHFAPMKKHLGWYCKGFTNAKELRMKLMKCNSADEVEKTVNENLSLLT